MATTKIAGGSFLIEERTPAECFFPEDFSEEQRQIAQMTSDFAHIEILPVNDAIDQHSSRPDFQVLIYPGNSGRYTVTKQSPPVFILCGYQDRPDISEGMARLYLKYKELGVPAELHIYSNIGHGFGVRDTNKGGYSEWPQRLLEWLTTVPFPAHTSAASH